MATGTLLDAPGQHGGNSGGTLGILLARIDEPDVALTDLGLAMESALFAVLLSRGLGDWPRLQRWGTCLFTATAIASLAGGIDHGFFRRMGRENIHEGLWTTTLLAIGGSAWALAGLGAGLLPRPCAPPGLRRASSASLVAYSTAILSGQRTFRSTLLAHIPATIVFLDALVRRRRCGHREGFLSGVTAITISLTAAVGRERRIGFPSAGITHNTLYHLFQALSLALLFDCVRDVIAVSEGGRSCSG